MKLFSKDFEDKSIDITVVALKNHLCPIGETCAFVAVGFDNSLEQCPYFVKQGPPAVCLYDVEDITAEFWEWPEDES